MDGDWLMGFYRMNAETGELDEAPNSVHAPGYSLLEPEHDQYTYPVDGWTWYPSMAAAVAGQSSSPLSDVDLLVRAEHARETARAAYLDGKNRTMKLLDEADKIGSDAFLAVLAGG